MAKKVHITAQDWAASPTVSIQLKYSTGWEEIEAPPIEVARRIWFIICHRYPSLKLRMVVNGKVATTNDGLDKRGSFKRACEAGC